MAADVPPLRRPLVLGALASGVVAVAWPFFALAGLLACIVVAASSRGRERWFAGLGLALCLVGLGRFIVGDMARAIVLAGRRSGEERAVSRLREVQWAESMAMEGGKPALPMAGLVSTPGLLAPDRFTPVPDQPTRYAGDGYVFEVHVEPTDRARYYAYAWPRDEASGARLFFGDERQRVCEAQVGPGGAFAPPGPHAALASAAPDDPRCGAGSDGRAWRPWRNKAPEPEARDPTTAPVR